MCVCYRIDPFLMTLSDHFQMNFNMVLVQLTRFQLTPSVEQSQCDDGSFSYIIHVDSAVCSHVCTSQHTVCMWCVC